MPTRSRTYWLTEPCRIRREGGSLRIERPDHTPVRIPITDVRDLVAFELPPVFRRLSIMV